jgi:four helix bundle protein
MEDKVAPKSLDFAIRIVKMYKYIIETHKGFVLSKQLLRSETTVGALIREAEHAQSKADFLNKMNISLKEANETLYGLILLKETDYVNPGMYSSISQDCEELVRMLASIAKTTKTQLGR